MAKDCSNLWVSCCFLAGEIYKRELGSELLVQRWTEGRSNANADLVASRKEQACETSLLVSLPTKN
jgi:hypothetical protein